MMFVIFMKLNETKIWSKFLTTPGRVPPGKTTNTAGDPGPVWDSNFI
jgi:hypothetical protein